MLRVAVRFGRSLTIVPYFGEQQVKFLYRRAGLRNEGGERFDVDLLEIEALRVGPSGPCLLPLGLEHLGGFSQDGGIDARAHAEGVSSGEGSVDAPEGAVAPKGVPVSV